MKLKIKTNMVLLTAFVLGLLVCNFADAQVRINPNRLNPRLLGQMPPLNPRPSNGINPAQLSRALGGRLLPGVINTPWQGAGPIPQSELNLPDGFGQLGRVDPQPQPIPQTQPQPTGPTFQLGPNGPSLNLGNGQRLNIPLGRNFRQQPYPNGYQTPTYVTGYGPNGEVYTGNQQVGGSYYAPGRNLSQMNGSQRQVQQPIYDSYGNIVGYQAGTVWQNSLTGQQHGNMTTYTPNGTGGMHETNTQYSTAGGNITPMNK